MSVSVVKWKRCYFRYAQCREAGCGSLCLRAQPGYWEIKDPEKDLLPGEMNIPEPRKARMSSRWAVVICRVWLLIFRCLGRGKAYYDGFLELKGKIPLDWL